MEFSNYQNQAIRITHYKKSMVTYSDEQKNTMIDLLGVELYFITAMCYDYGVTLETVALRNLAKLRKRQRLDSGDTP